MPRRRLTEAEKATRLAERQRSGPTREVMRVAEAAAKGPEPAYTPAILLKAFFRAFGGMDAVVDRMVMDWRAMEPGSRGSVTFTQMLTRTMAAAGEEMRGGDTEMMSLEDLESTLAATLRGLKAQGVDLAAGGLLHDD